MTITDIRISIPANRPAEQKCLAFASITFDDSFCVRDLKIIDGDKGLFVAMPSRRIMDRCGCGWKNHLCAAYCNHCGEKLNEYAVNDFPHKFFSDVCFPVNHKTRDMIEQAVLDAFEREERLEAVEPVTNGEPDDALRFPRG